MCVCVCVCVSVCVCLCVLRWGAFQNIYTLAGRSHRRKNEDVIKCGQIEGIIGGVSPQRMDENEGHGGSFHFEIEEDRFFFLIPITSIYFRT